MNGINLRKLGAIVAGGAILASSVAFAGLVFQNTELVNANGQPVAKIVVGEDAAASDGVAAAMIATKIANSAYAEKVYTAAVQGTATCGAAAAGAACTVTDKTVTLSIVYPGMTGTAIHEFAPLIAETLDREVNDRAPDYQSVSSDLEDEKSHPFQDQDGAVFLSSVIPESDANEDTARYYKIDGSQLSALADYSMASKTATSTYTEAQKIYLMGYTAYDSNEEAVKYVPESTVYQMVFGPDEEGLSLCPGDDGTAVGDCDETDALGKNRYKIKLLGSDWVISDVVEGDGAVLNATDGAVYGSDTAMAVPEDSTFTLKLAKEASYNPALHKGECMNTTDAKICLSDISRETGTENTHPAILSIYDTAGNLVTEKQVTEGTTEEIVVGTKTIKVHVYQTAPGYAMQAMWAEIAIYADEIELNEGKEFTYGIEGWDGDDSNWNVYFGLVDVNSNGADEDVSNATGIRAITFATTESDAMSEGDLFEGDSYYIIDSEGYQGFQVTNNGLEDWNMDSLKFEYKSGGTAATANITEYVKITSQQDKAFDVDGMGWKRGSTLLIGYNESGGVVALKDSDNEWQVDTYSNEDIFYEYAGDQSLIVSEDFDNTGDSSVPANLVNFTVTYVENVGDVNATDSITGNMSFFVDFSAADGLLGEIDGNDDEVMFGIPAELGGTYGYSDGDTYDVGFVTPRGTEFSSESTTTRTYKVPAYVRHVLMAVKPTSVNASRNSEIIGPLHEGDSATVGGTITVTVDSIDVESSASVSGGSSGSAADMSKVSAVIKDSSGATMSTLTAKDVYAIDAAQFVYLDSQAPATGTIITVGGPAVNSVTAAAMEGAAVDLSADNPVVTKEAGDKIIVAGWTADDTITAAAQFIAALKAQ
jgi:hypothetical protein